MTRIAIFNEFCHERENEDVKKIYPNGIHGAIKDFLACDDYEIITTTLDDHEQVLTAEFLETVDVLLWWGHMKHQMVKDEVAELVCDAVHSGMGFIPLHSAHHSKPFKRLMGTPCHLSWRESDFERIWTIDPSHPIAQGVGRYFELEQGIYKQLLAEPKCMASHSPFPNLIKQYSWVGTQAASFSVQAAVISAVTVGFSISSPATSHSLHIITKLFSLL